MGSADVLKSPMRKIAYKAVETPVSDIKGRIADKDVVSFDIFDTLVTRDIVRSQDIVELIAPYAAVHTGMNETEFVVWRQSAERELSRLIAPREPTLEQIYSVFPDSCDEVVAELVTLEERAEVALAEPCEDMVEVFEWCKANGKRTLLVSDTYLRRECIQAILDHCGICGFDELYVSSEGGARKYSGALFDAVLKSENRLPADIVHIGNSIVSDYLRPRERGVEAALVKAAPRQGQTLLQGQNATRHNTAAASLMWGFILNHEPAYKSEYSKMGYEVLGPLLLSFTWWLHETVKSLPDDTALLFLAREGVLLERAFEKIYPDDFSARSVIRISRRSAVGCCLDSVDDLDSLSKLLATFDLDCVSVSELIDLGYIPKDFGNNLCTRHGVSPDFNLIRAADADDIAARDRIMSVLIPLLNKYGAEQKKLFDMYLDSLGAKIAACKSACIVDVGWRGSMQDALSRMLVPDRFSQLFGAYYGVQPSPMQVEGSEKYGALFNNDNLDDQYVIDLTGQIFELMFMDSEGTTCCYCNERGKPRPLLADSEYSQNMLRIVELIQQGAFDFIESYLEHPFIGGQRFEVGEAFENYKELAVDPPNRIIDLFRGFVTNDVRVTSLMASRHSLYYLSHPKVFARELKENHCKSLFLKSILRLPLPYHAVCAGLKKASQHKREAWAMDDSE